MTVYIVTDNSSGAIRGVYSSMRTAYGEWSEDNCEVEEWEIED